MPLKHYRESLKAGAEKDGVKTREFCKWCSSVIKGSEVNSHSCLFKIAAEMASLKISNGECRYCNCIVRHTKESPCNERLISLLGAALRGTCSETLKCWITTELLGTTVAVVPENEMIKDQELVEKIKAALKLAE
ncbi:hypothetical protein L1987_72729 [Smallanthus sonchifolius]|uniref:Uncharacterized protein n=1 Tax=Smallanthus sonchifolius TaxID=185202 RepID=A0ACB9AVM4_9ASTR|nr:hypothetical protein L1987_72729 [Smallanthus sonchifolius]